MKIRKLILIVIISIFGFGVLVYADSKMTQDQACNMVKLKFDIDISCEKGKYVDKIWLDDVLSKIKDRQIQNKLNNKIEIKIEIDNSNNLNDALLNQISNKLNNSTISKDSIYNDIKNIVSGANDQYTVFFPPTEATDFNEQLEGEYQGIGAYVDMPKPGELIITAPIDGSPAQKAGIKAGDRVIKIDDNIVTEKIDIKTAISWIKGLEATSVKLIIIRTKNNKSRAMTFNIKRENIVIKNVTSKIYNDNICYMNIGMFGYGVYNEFVDNLNKTFTDKCKKYVFDVRNNPGGSLDEVANMLSFFVPTGKPAVVVKSKTDEQSMLAIDASPKLTKKNIIVLQNQYSASASEIFAGSIRDYGSHVKLIGEKSFGKGSVQELVEYSDGSMLKYTVAKWYTGGSKTSVDHNGLDPDIKVIDDPKTVEDDQLQYALKYKFGN